MNNSPIFCFPYESNEEIQLRLKNELKKYTKFDSEKNCVLPKISQCFPEKAMNTRLSILTQVYNNDYHTDSFDTSRIIKRINDNNELIWFWGAESQIKRLLLYFHSKKKVGPKNLLLGTVTAINASEEFGLGVAELCRSGSIDNILPGKPPIIHRILSYLSKEDESLYNRFHTLCLVPRTRKSEPGIRGGEAVHTIHTKYLRSRFWGFAPWYVMQGGLLELLEYREINRNIEDIINDTNLDNYLYILDFNEAEFVKCLYSLNFNRSPNIINDLDDLDYFNIKASLLSVNDPNIKEFNHETLICYTALESQNSKTSCHSFNDLLNVLLVETCSCKVVRLNLMEKSHLAIQKRIKDLGFKLTMISPQRITWYLNDRSELININEPAHGFWCLPNASLRIAPPYYVDFKTNNVLEEYTLTYLRSLFTYRL